MEENKDGKSVQDQGITLFGWPLAIVAGIYLFDQLTKWLVVEKFEIGSSVEVIPGFFSLVHLRNTGAAWSIMSGYTWLLGLISLLAFAVMACLFKRWNNGSKLLAADVAMLLGGIAGNMTDRIFRHSVVDFLDFYVKDCHWPAFNVADSAICVAIAVLFIVNWKQTKSAKNKVE